MSKGSLSLEFPTGWFNAETREGYFVSRDIKRLWGALLDMAVQIDMICKRHNIKYFICGGTLLGAVRHNGFIPWDDDFDVMMKRNDYNRFCEIAPKELMYPYFFQTEKTDPGYLLRHAKIRNSMTTGMFRNHVGRGYKFNQGVFVDIFPLDNLPDDKQERCSYYQKLFDLWGKVYRLSAYVNRCERPGGLWNNSATFLTSRILHLIRRGDFYNEMFERLAGKYKDAPVEECCLFAGHLMPNGLKNTHLWKTRDYVSFRRARFEFLEFPIPCNYEPHLTTLYGDWHKIVMGANSHGELLVDLDQSYVLYA